MVHSSPLPHPPRLRSCSPCRWPHPSPAIHIHWLLSHHNLRAPRKNDITAQWMRTVSTSPPPYPRAHLPCAFILNIKKSRRVRRRVWGKWYLDMIIHLSRIPLDPVSKLKEMKSNQFRFLANCPPTPPLTQSQQGRGRWAVSRLRWTVSYKSLYFVHPGLELVPLFTGMRENRKCLINNNINFCLSPCRYCHRLWTFPVKLESTEN